ncbi:TRAP transporter large permease subunit [Chloroflexota bacterium]
MDRISTMAGGIAGVMTGLSAFVILFEIIMRYVFRQPQKWEYEIVIYLMMWFVFLAMSFSQKQGAHIQVDLLTQRLPETSRQILSLATYSISLFYTTLFSYYAFKLVTASYAVHERGMYYLSVQVWPVKIAVFVGMVLLSLQTLRSFIRHCYIMYQQRSENPRALRKGLLVILPLFAAFITIGLLLIKLNPIIGLITLMFILLLGGVPVGFALGLLAAAGFFLLFGGVGALPVLATTSYGELNSFVLIALPLFIFAGQIMQSSKLAEQLFKVAAAFIGHIPGGLGVATMMSCAIFAAISGSSVATAATIGLIAIPALLARGYTKRMACGIVAAGGTLGILIPPSNSMIIIGVIAEESVGRLFIAGLIPGIILATMLSITIVLRAKMSREYEPLPKTSWKERFTALKKAIWALMLPFIILFGIYTGIFTATEAAGAAVVYAIAAGLLSRTIKIKDLGRILGEATSSIGMLFMIIVGALVLGLLVTKLRIAHDLVSLILAANTPAWVFVVVIMALCIVLGMFMEGIAITLIVFPIVVVPLKALGLDIIWFAVLFTMNMELACITPPKPLCRATNSQRAVIRGPARRGHICPRATDCFGTHRTGAGAEPMASQHYVTS